MRGKLTPEQKAELLVERQRFGYPPHSPPRLNQDDSVYLLTATYYNHEKHLNTVQRRQSLLNLIFDKFISNELEIHAWVVMTNHYHILLHVTQFSLLPKIFHSIHGNTSYAWNLEDGKQGRKIWYSYSDRLIRSDRHYYTTLNYIHYNPVKHKAVNSPYDWEECSVHWYVEYNGREWLRDLWSSYPVKEYGKGWDDDLS